MGEKQVIDALRILHETKTPVTFRAAGTSLSGQSISDSVLLQARGDQWNSYEIIDKGELIKTQPGITGLVWHVWSSLEPTTPVMNYVKRRCWK